MDSEEANPLYDQLVCIHETAAQFIEQADESFAVSISHLDWDSLSDEQRGDVMEWHKNIQAAASDIRFGKSDDR